MAFTKKIAGWVAGRIKGEQARKDTMRWMEKTGLGQVLDIAGDIALTQGAIKGVSGLKGLMTGQKALPALSTGQASTTLAPLPAPAAAPVAAPVAAPAAAATQAPMRAMVAPGAGAGPVTPRIGMPQMPTSLPPVAGGGAPTPIASQVSASLRAPTGGMALPAAGGAAPTPIAGQVSAGMRPPTPPTPAPTFAAAPRPALPPAPSPMQAMTAPAAAPAAAPMAAPTGGMTPPMRATAQRMGGIENVANANITRGAGGLRGAAQFARENASWLGPAATATGNVIGSAIDRSVEEEKMRREQEARNRLAMLLMPMFQAQMGQAAPSFQPRG